MGNKRILLVEKGGARQAASFRPPLAENGFDIVGAKTGSEAEMLLSEASFDLVIVNAASLGTSGTRMIRDVKQKAAAAPVVLISEAAEGIPEGVADESIPSPCSFRKLHNRLDRFLSYDPRNELVHGPIHLDPKQRVVRAHGRNTLLTKRQAKLLQVLLESPGECVAREELMQRVWDTTYMGDTRTLDVHISWLRKAIEPNPNQPQYLMTLRGVGYRLEVPEI